MKQNKWLRNTECEFLSLLCSQLSQCCRADYCHSLFPAPGGCVALLHRHSQGSKRQTEASRWTTNTPIFYLCRSERKRRWRKKKKKIEMWCSVFAPNTKNTSHACLRSNRRASEAGAGWNTDLTVSRPGGRWWPTVWGCSLSSLLSCFHASEGRAAPAVVVTVTANIDMLYAHWIEREGKYVFLRKLFWARISLLGTDTSDIQSRRFANPPAAVTVLALADFAAFQVPAVWDLLSPALAGILRFNGEQSLPSSTPVTSTLPPLKQMQLNLPACGGPLNSTHLTAEEKEE